MVGCYTFYHEMRVRVTDDISETKKRTKLAKKLLDFGPRVQYSVFEADVSPSELDKLHAMLKEVALEKDDSIRVYKLCESCKKDITLYGSGEVTKTKIIASRSNSCALFLGVFLGVG